MQGRDSPLHSSGWRGWGAEALFLVCWGNGTLPCAHRRGRTFNRPQSKRLAFLKTPVLTVTPATQGSTSPSAALKVMATR